MVFEPDFQKNVMSGKEPEIQVNIDATRMSQAFTGSGYITEILKDEISKFIGMIFPTSHMLTISRGIFNKALEFRDLHQSILILLIMIPIILGLGVVLQKKQES